MRSYNPDEPLISIHIPKCGGTSLTQVLAGWFGRRFYPHYFIQKTTTLPPRQRLITYSPLRRLRGLRYRRHVCVHGHFNRDRGFGIADYYPEVRQFITVMRDPFEIALSDYFYMKSYGKNWFENGRRAPIADRFRDLSDFFERAIVPRPTYLLNHMPVVLTPDNYRRVMDELFVYVGVAEDLPAAVRQLAARLGFPAVEVSHSNVSPRDEPVLPGMRDAFMRSHPLDYAVYTYAQELAQAPL